MNDFDCAETQRQVHEYLQAELTGPMADAVTAHLANCDSCDSEFHIENKLNEMIKQACGEEPRAELLQVVQERLRNLTLGKN